MVVVDSQPTQRQEVQLEEQQQQMETTSPLKFFLACSIVITILSILFGGGVVLICSIPAIFLAISVSIYDFPKQCISMKCLYYIYIYRLILLLNEGMNQFAEYKLPSVLFSCHWFYWYLQLLLCHLYFLEYLLMLGGLIMILILMTIALMFNLEKWT